MLEYTLAIVVILLGIILQVVIPGPISTFSFSDAIIKKEKSEGDLGTSSKFIEYKFIELSKGKVQYGIYQSSESEIICKRPIVLVHGISLGATIWEETAKYLSEKQPCPVIVYDLYGRGRSDAAFPNDEKLFVGQLAELIFALQKFIKLGSIEGFNSIDLVGVSMGGAIVASFAETYHYVVNSLILVCPAGLPVKVPLIAQLGNLPLLGEVVLPLLGKKILTQHVKEGYVKPEDPMSKKHIQKVTQYIHNQVDNHPGFLLSLLSTLRYFPLSDTIKSYEVIAKEFSTAKKKVLLLWGDKDVTTPFKNKDQMLAILEGVVVFKNAPGCAHADILATKGCVPKVWDQMLEFIGKENENPLN